MDSLLPISFDFRVLVEKREIWDQGDLKELRYEDIGAIPF